MRLVVKAGSPCKVEADAPDFTAKACSKIELPMLSLKFFDANNNICSHGDLKEVEVACKEGSRQLLSIEPANDTVANRLRKPKKNPLVLAAGDLMATPTNEDVPLISSEEVTMTTVDLCVKASIRRGPNKGEYLTCDIQLSIEAGKPSRLELIAGKNQKVMHDEKLKKPLQFAVFDSNGNRTAPDKGEKQWKVKLIVKGKGNEEQPELLGKTEAPVLNNGVATLEDLKASWMLPVLPKEGKAVDLSAKLVTKENKDNEGTEEVFMNEKLGQIQVIPSNKPTKVVLLRDGVPWPITHAEKRVKAGSIIEGLSMRLTSQASGEVAIDTKTFLPSKKGVKPSWATNWVWAGVPKTPKKQLRGARCHILPELKVPKEAPLNGSEHEYTLSVTRAGDGQELMEDFSLIVEPAVPHHWDILDYSEGGPRLEIEGGGSQCGDCLNDMLGIIVVKDEFGNRTKPLRDAPLQPAIMIKDEFGNVANLDNQALKLCRDGESWSFQKNLKINASPGNWKLFIVSSTASSLQPFQVGVTVVRAPPAKLRIRSPLLGAADWRTSHSVKVHAGVKVTDLEVLFTDSNNGQPRIGVDQVAVTVVRMAGKDAVVVRRNLEVTEAMVTEGILLLDPIPLSDEKDGSIEIIASIVRRDKTKVKLKAALRVELMRSNRVKELHFCTITDKPGGGGKYSAAEVDEEVSVVLAENTPIGDPSTFIRSVRKVDVEADSALPQLVLFTKTDDDTRRYVPPEGSYSVTMAVKGSEKGAAEPLDEIPYQQTRMKHCIVFDDKQGVPGLVTRSVLEVSVQYTEQRSEIEELLMQLGKDMCISSKIQMPIMPGTARVLQPQKKFSSLLSALSASLSTTAANRRLTDKVKFEVRDKSENITTCKGPIVSYIQSLSENGKKRHAPGDAAPVTILLEGAAESGELKGKSTKDGFMWEFSFALQAVDLADESMEKLSGEYELVVQSQHENEQHLRWTEKVEVNADTVVLQQTRALKEQLGPIEALVGELEKLKAIQELAGKELTAKVQALPKDLSQLAPLENLRDTCEWCQSHTKDLKADIDAYKKEEAQRMRIPPRALVHRTQQDDASRRRYVPRHIGVLIRLATVEDMKLARLISWLIGPTNAETTVVRTTKEYHAGISGKLRMCCLEQMINYNKSGVVNAKLPLDNKRIKDEPGFLGFAINFLEFDEFQKIELRGTVFYQILGKRCIFDNQESCRKFQEKYKGDQKMRFELIALDKGIRFKTSGFGSGKDSDCCNVNTVIPNIFGAPNNPNPRAARAEAQVNEMEKLTDAVDSYVKADDALTKFTKEHPGNIEKQRNELKRQLQYAGKGNQKSRKRGRTN
ncbi:unnamed protein product [Chrysoparadoxa australica]